MDIDLGPGMDRTVADEEILASRDLPIVFLSGHTDPDYVQRCERIASYGYLVRMNPVAERLTAWIEEDAVGRPLVDVFTVVYGTSRTPIEDPVKRVIRSGEIVTLSNDSILRAGDGREYRIADNAHRSGREMVHYTAWFLYSVTLLNAMKLFGRFARSSCISTVYLRAYRTGSAPLIGRTRYEAFHDLSEICPVCPAQRTFETGEVAEREISDNPDSPTRWLSAVTFPVKDQETGTVEAVLALVHDITGRKKHQQETERLLREKEILLKEAHHRIQNSISTIISLLSLQERRAEGDDVADALRDARSRMQSMSLLYEILFQSEKLEEMSIRTVVPSLVRRIRDTFPEGERLVAQRGSRASRLWC